MLTFLACIALIDLGIGFFVGTYWILPIAVGPAPQSEQQQQPMQSVQTAESALINEQNSSEATAPDSHHSTSQAAPTVKNNKDSSVSTAKHSWQAAASSARTDIAALNDRIRYAITANDKQLAKELAADIRARAKLWQKQMQDLLAQLTAEYEQDASATIDLVTPELCLAQIETLQTNLDLLEWSDTCASLEKLQRELASINKLLPVAG